MSFIYLLTGLLSSALMLPTQDGQQSSPGIEIQEDVIVFNFGPEGEAGETIASLTSVLQEVTGRNFILNESVRSTALEQAIALYGQKVVPKERLYTFYQTVLRTQGFACVEWADGPEEVVEVVPINPENMALIKANAKMLEIGEVEDYADQPGVYVAAVVPLRHAQAQSVGVNLRSAMGSSAAGFAQDAFMPLPRENSLLVQGFAPFVDSAVRMLQRLDVPTEHSFASSPTVARRELEQPAAASSNEGPAESSSPDSFALTDWMIPAILVAALYVGLRHELRGIKLMLRSEG